jgi:hypothetical protein
MILVVCTSGLNTNLSRDIAMAGSSHHSVARITSPARVHVSADSGSLVLSTLPAGHAIVVIEAENITWLKISAKAGTKKLEGFVLRNKTSYSP